MTASGDFSVPFIQPPSARALADLAQSGYMMLRRRAMRAAFEVHHVADRPGYLGDCLAPLADRGSVDGLPDFGEMLANGASGLGLVAIVRSHTDAKHYHARDIENVLVHSEQARIFHGNAYQSPTLFYDGSTRRYEALIAIDPAARTFCYWHSRAISEVVHKISELSAEHHAPIIFIHSPATSVPRSGVTDAAAATGNQEHVLEGSTPITVHFAFALHFSNVDGVLRLSEILSEYCSTHGFGFWLADNLSESNNDRWALISQWSPREKPVLLHMTESDVADVSYALPVTLVGPYRLSSSQVIMSVISQYEAVGVAGCSVTCLEGLAFIHLQLVSRGVPEEAFRDFDQWDRNKNLDPYNIWSQPPSEALHRVLSALAPDQSSPFEPFAELARHAGDYQCMVGPVRAVRPGYLNSRLTLWFSWQARNRDANSATTLLSLLQALDDIGLVKNAEGGRAHGPMLGTPNVEYLILRNIGNAPPQATGKVSVEPSAALALYRSTALQPRLTDLCARIEDAWYARLRQRASESNQELSVAARDYWLGDWTSAM